MLGWTSGVVFVLVMAAGADRPPPPGFLLFVGYGALIGALIGRVLPHLLELWDDRGAGAALARAALWGFAGGLVLMALTMVVSTGEPSIDVDAAARLIGFAVVGAVGAVGAAGLSATARVLDRRHHR
jgi:hypothetical protein